jgi:transposase
MPLPNTRDLTDAQWSSLDVLIPEPSRRRDLRGRPWKDRRTVLNGILWVLRTGAPWSALPERYPSYQTCHRRFQQWVRSGIMRGVFEALAEDLRIRGRLNVREAFIDGSFAQQKKGFEDRQNETWQGNKDHGRRRPLRPSCCCVR